MHTRARECVQHAIVRADIGGRPAEGSNVHADVPADVPSVQPQEVPAHDELPRRRRGLRSRRRPQIVVTHDAPLVSKAITI